METHFTLDEEIAAAESEAIKAGVPKDKVLCGKAERKIILSHCGFTGGPAEVRRVALKFGHFER